MHPILFQIGDFVIGTYGVMIVIGMMAALWLCKRLARRRGLNPDFFYDLIFVLLVSGFLGARILFIFSIWDDFVQAPMAYILSREGFVFQGGFVAALAVGIWFTRWRRQPLLEVVDIAAPALALAHAFGRIGCHLAGCCYGATCAPGHEGHGLFCNLAVQYPLLIKDGQPMAMFNFAYGGQIQAGLLAPGAAAPLPVIPVQLFESAGNFLIFGALLWLWGRRKWSGQAFALYMALYSVMRFSLEFLRGDADRGLYFGGMISTGQIIAILTLMGAIGLWAWRRNKGLQEVPAWATEEGANAGEAAARAAAPGKPAGKTKPARAGQSRKV